MKDSFSEDAANTVIVPVAAAGLLLAAGEDELPEPEAVLDELPLEQPATAIAASAAMVRAKRRMPAAQGIDAAPEKAGSFLVETGIIPRTMPSTVAWRK